jgi:Bacterial Ig domain
MNIQSRNPVVTRVGLRAVFVPRVRSVVPLVFLSFAILTASAQAHTVTATAVCKSVTFHWTAFSSSGYGNHGHNTPDWSIVFTPTGGTATTQRGNVSFDGSSFSLTVPIGGGNGTVTPSSSWRSDQTRDGHSASWSKRLTISDCPVVVQSPPRPVPPVAPVSLASPALVTTASDDVALGGSIHDTAVLSGGSSPTGTITFNLYAGTDASCSTVLSTAAVPVTGAGNYDSPAVTPSSAGTYQWVATYSGDGANNAVSNACNDPNEQATVAVTIVEASCIPSPVALRGVSAKVRRALTAHVTALGVKSVTFYLDGRKLATVTKATNHRYSVRINARKLGYGRHRLTARATMRDATCASAAAAGSFVKVKPPTIRPKFAG